MAKATKAPMKGIRMVTKMTEAEVTQSFKQDMQESKARAQFKDDPKWQEYSLIALAQRKEFGKWVAETVMKAQAQGRTVDFLASMASKLSYGIELTDNMVSALRKWKERDVPKGVKGASPAKPEKVVTLTLKIKKFLQGQMKLDSRLITGVLKGESAKAYLIEGHADMLQDHSWCLRCGQQLTQPASYTIGFGETCAEHMGIPYPGNLNKLTGKQKLAYRKQILGVLHKQKFERWIPKSQVEEVVARKESAPTPPKGGKKK